MTITELKPQLFARQAADTIDSEPRADYSDRLEQLNYNFIYLRDRITLDDHAHLQLAAGYATDSEWKQLEATYQLDTTLTNY